MSPCVIWIQNLLRNQRDNLRLDGITRSGQRITIANRTICRLSFYMMKTGTPTGTLYSRIRNSATDAILQTSADTVNVAALGAAYAWYNFSFNLLVNLDVRLLVEIVGGTSNATNYVRVGNQGTNVIAGVHTYYLGAYSDFSGEDETIKIWEWLDIGGARWPLYKYFTLTV